MSPLPGGWERPVHKSSRGALGESPLEEPPDDYCPLIPAFSRPSEGEGAS
jgi:hypothetical protein